MGFDETEFNNDCDIDETYLGFINYLYHFWLLVESSVFTHFSHVLTLFEDNGGFISLPLFF